MGSLFHRVRSGLRHLFILPRADFESNLLQLETKTLCWMLMISAGLVIRRLA